MKAGGSVSDLSATASIEAAWHGLARPYKFSAKFSASRAALQRLTEALQRNTFAEVPSADFDRRDIDESLTLLSQGDECAVER
jgi:hypothetical protein